MVQDVMTSSPGPIGSTKKNGGVVEVIVKSVSNGLSETLGRVSLGAGAQGAADVRPLTYLFDPELVPEIAKTGLPEGITVRPLARDDHKRNHLHLLSNLTHAPQLEPDVYTAQFDHCVSCPKTYFVLVFIHEDSDRVVASGTLIVEHKFLRNAGKVGHIEDIAVDPSMKGTGLGKRLVVSLETLARDLGCYKTILDCNEDNIGFYEKCGFTHKEYEMVRYAPITEDNSVSIVTLAMEEPVRESSI